MCWIHLRYSSVAIISASEKLQAVHDCRLETQCKGLFILKMKLDRDLDLKRSTSSYACEGWGIEASWGPQLSSVRGRIVDYGIGNLK